MTDFRDARAVLSNLRHSGAYSDVTIICGPVQIPAHRSVICPQSPFFEKACEGPWTEAKAGVVTLHAVENDDDGLVAGDNPYAVELMIDYLYLHDYFPKPDTTWKAYVAQNKRESNAAATALLPPLPEENQQVSPAEEDVQRTSASLGEDLRTTSRRKHKKGKARRLAGIECSAVDTAEPNGTDCTLALHAEVYAMGAKYQIAPLQEAALSKFQEEAEANWDTMQFIDSIDIAFRTTPENDSQLRSAIKTLIVEHCEQLSESNEFAETVACIDGLAFDLFQELFSHTLSLREECASLRQQCASTTRPLSRW